MSYLIEGARDLILSTLVAIVQDRNATSAVRVQASRTLAEVLGMLKQAPKAASASAIEELSEGELDALIAARGAPAPAPDSAAISEAKPVAGKRLKRSRVKRTKL